MHNLRPEAQATTPAEHTRWPWVGSYHPPPGAQTPGEGAVWNPTPGALAQLPFLCSPQGPPGDLGFKGIQGPRGPPGLMVSPWLCPSPWLATRGTQVLLFLLCSAAGLPPSLPFSPHSGSPPTHTEGASCRGRLGARGLVPAGGGDTQAAPSLCSWDYSAGLEQGHSALRLFQGKEGIVGPLGTLGPSGLPVRAGAGRETASPSRSVPREPGLPSGPVSLGSGLWFVAGSEGRQRQSRGLGEWRDEGLGVGPGSACV